VRSCGVKALRTSGTGAKAEIISDTGAVTRPAGVQDFGTWFVSYPPQLQPVDLEIRTVHACWFSLQFVPTNLGPWRIP
jgi:hypothetical protein